MANATINGITFSDLSVSEVLAIASRYAPAPVDNRHTEEIVQQVSEKPSEKREVSNTATLVSVMAKCGHPVMRASAKGRKPNLCGDCGGNRRNAENPSENGSEKTPKRSEKARTKKDRDAWMDKPASDNQIERILHGMRHTVSGEVVIAGLDGRVISKKDRATLISEIDAGITGGRARVIWNDVKSMKLTR